MGPFMIHTCGLAGIGIGIIELIMRVLKGLISNRLKLDRENLRLLNHGTPICQEIYVKRKMLLPLLEIFFSEPVFPGHGISRFERISLRTQEKKPPY